MEISLPQLPPGDSHLVEAIIGQIKSKGIFDKFRKDCLSDVDTKPAFQNLRLRVEGQVKRFLGDKQWTYDTNKNQLRDGVRKDILESGILDTGIDAIINQVVNPKINSLILPLVEDNVYAFLSIEKPKREIRDEPMQPEIFQPMEEKHVPQMQMDPFIPHYEIQQKIQQYLQRDDRFSVGEKESREASNEYARGPIKCEEFKREIEDNIKHEHPTVKLLEKSQPSGSLPMDVISSDDDDILKQVSLESQSSNSPKPTMNEGLKALMEEDNAVDSFDQARRDSEAVTRAVDKMSLKESLESLEVDQKSSDRGLPLFDKQSLDSISSNSTGLSFSPGFDEKSKKDIESKETSNNVRSTQSTPLEDEKKPSDDISSLGSNNSNNSTDVTFMPKDLKSDKNSLTSYGELSDTKLGKGSENNASINIAPVVVDGASPVSADDSQTSFQDPDEKGPESVKEKKSTIKTIERSEGELSSSSSSNTGNSKDSFCKDSRLESQKDKYGKDREKFQDHHNKDSRDKSNKHSKSSKHDDHYSHHDKHHKHRRDRDDDRDRHSSKGHSSSHQHSTSSSSTSKSTSESMKDKQSSERSEHKSHSSGHSRSDKKATDKSNGRKSTLNASTDIFSLALDNKIKLGGNMVHNRMLQNSKRRSSVNEKQSDRKELPKDTSKNEPDTKAGLKKEDDKKTERRHSTSTEKVKEGKVKLLDKESKIVEEKDKTLDSKKSKLVVSHEKAKKRDEKEIEKSNNKRYSESLKADEDNRKRKELSKIKDVKQKSTIKSEAAKDEVKQMESKTKDIRKDSDSKNKAKPHSRPSSSNIKTIEPVISSDSSSVEGKTKDRRRNGDVNKNKKRDSKPDKSVSKTVISSDSGSNSSDDDYAKRRKNKKLRLSDSSGSDIQSDVQKGNLELRKKDGKSQMERNKHSKRVSKSRSISTSSSGSHSSSSESSSTESDYDKREMLTKNKIFRKRSSDTKPSMGKEGKSKCLSQKEEEKEKKARIDRNASTSKVAMFSEEESSDEEEKVSLRNLLRNLSEHSSEDEDSNPSKSKLSSVKRDDKLSIGHGQKVKIDGKCSSKVIKEKKVTSSSLPNKSKRSKSEETSSSSESSDNGVSLRNLLKDITESSSDEGFAPQKTSLSETKDNKSSRKNSPAKSNQAISKSVERKEQLRSKLLKSSSSSSSSSELSDSDDDIPLNKIASPVKRKQNLANKEKLNAKQPVVKSKPNKNSGKSVSSKKSSPVAYSFSALDFCDDSEDMSGFEGFENSTNKKSPTKAAKKTRIARVKVGRQTCYVEEVETSSDEFSAFDFTSSDESSDIDFEGFEDNVFEGWDAIDAGNQKIKSFLARYTEDACLDIDDLWTESPVELDSTPHITTFSSKEVSATLIPKKPVSEMPLATFDPMAHSPCSSLSSESTMIVKANCESNQNSSLLLQISAKRSLCESSSSDECSLKPKEKKMKNDDSADIYSTHFVPKEETSTKDYDIDFPTPDTMYSPLSPASSTSVDHHFKEKDKDPMSQVV